MPGFTRTSLISFGLTTTTFRCAAAGLPKRTIRNIHDPKARVMRRGCLSQNRTPLNFRSDIHMPLDAELYSWRAVSKRFRNPPLRHGHLVHQARPLGEQYYA